MMTLAVDQVLLVKMNEDGELVIVEPSEYAGVVYQGSTNAVAQPYTKFMVFGGRQIPTGRGYTVTVNDLESFEIQSNEMDGGRMALLSLWHRIYKYAKSKNITSMVVLLEEGPEIAD